MKLPINACRTCRDHGTASDYALCPGLDVFYGDLHLPCPYEQFGCRSYIPYYRAASHQSACERAPCLCPETGCAFAAPPPALLAHLAAAHSWPVHKIPRYGAIHSLRVPASVPDLLLVVGEEEQQEDEEQEGEEEGKDDAEERPAVFVLSVRARGAATAVSVACVTANARAGPRYKCVLWAKAPAPRGAVGRAGPRLCMETDVPSCAAPGQAVTEDAMWLGVSPVMMLGASREIHLGVLIEKL
jgi:E3 ubiquitin-protein ligase SIAH1